MESNIFATLVYFLFFLQAVNEHGWTNIFIPLATFQNKADPNQSQGCIPAAQFRSHSFVTNHYE